MKARLVEHTLSILLVTALFGVIVFALRDTETSRQTARMESIEPYLQLDFLDFGDPLQRALFKETLTLFHPTTQARNDSILQAIQSYRQEQFTRQEYKTGSEERGLSGAKLARLGPMYLQFGLVYLIVMLVSYRVAQSIAILRFVKMKQGRTSYIAELLEHFKHHVPGPMRFVKAIFLLAKAAVKGISYCILFAPAYVIAYSMRTGFDTDSYLFMIVLGVVSNGLLINSANKFFTILSSESRKGYVQTAIVKNLNSSYTWGAADGVSYRAVLSPKSLFPLHVFRHIYVNARYQYLPSLKEHASFLITGLIIIEMALNIQGHLGYELMQNILYKQYDVAAAVVVGIFLIVKATEIVVDVWFHLESRKYENKG